MIGSLLVRRVAHVRGGRVRGRLRRLALGALGSDGSQAVSAAHSRRGRSIRRGVASFALLARAAAQHGSAAAAWAARSQGVRLETEGWVTFHGAKKIFMIFFAMCRLSCVRRLLFSSAYRNPRRNLADSSSAVRSCFSVALLAAPSIPRIVRDRWRGVRGIAQGVSFRRWQRRLSRALCGTSGAEIGESQGFSSRCRLLRDWKSLLDIMDIIYSICHILPLSSSSILILIRSIS